MGAGALCLALLSANASAWGDAGHKAVGAIADRLITNSNAQKHVDALLPGENLAQASVWADCVKGAFCGPQSAEMIEYTGANSRHAEYHYTDVPFRKNHYHLGEVGTRDHDIVQTLKQSIAALQGRAGDTENPHHFTPRQALLLIAHLAGDLHQPLHVGVAYIGKDGRFIVPERQKQVDAVNIFNSHGGNNFLLEDRRYWPARDASTMESGRREGRSLHSYWDVAVVEQAMRRIDVKSPEEFARVVIASNPEVPADTGAIADWPERWADDTLAASKKAYADVVAYGMVEQKNLKDETRFAWYVTVPEDYAVSSTALAQAQIVKGGYRLAALLKAIWP